MVKQTIKRKQLANKNAIITKQKKANKKKNATIRRLKSKLSPAGKYFNAIVDPFHPDSSGVKVPDFDGTPTFTLASKDIFSVSSDASGYIGGILFYGQADARYIAPATLTSGTITYGNGTGSVAWSDYTSGLLSTANATTCRCVAGGFKITNLLSLAGSTAASGRLVIAPISSSLATKIVSASGSYTEATLRKQPGAQVIPLAALAASSSAVTGVTGPMDPTGLCYIQPDFTFTTAYNDQPEFVQYAYIVTGAPASVSTLEIETVTHWEVCPVMSNGSLCTPAIESSTGMMDKVMNYLQEADLIQWGSNAFNYVSQMIENQQRGFHTLTNY